jgi:hypothetical protein
MREDMDSLQSKIFTYCSFIPLLEQRTNTSIRQELERLKQEITPNTSTKDFVDIVRQGLNILCDGHTHIAHSRAIKWFVPHSYLSAVDNISLDDTLHADHYYRLTIDSMYAQAQSGLRVKYIDGKYYNARPFTFNDAAINVGEVITAIDGIEINEFIQTHYSQINYISWDAKNKQFYADNFILSLPIMGKPEFTLTINNKEVVIDSRKLVDNLQREVYALPKFPKMEILGDDILYIYMPTMMQAEWYVSQLKQLYTPAIKKIIFDIRRNGGGDDSVWATLLEHIINEPFRYKYAVRMNYNEALKKAIADFGTIAQEGNTMTVRHDRTIYPDSSSISFSGKMYIIQDKNTYSAAAAFVSAALQNKNKITVIGEPATLISGYTFPPLMFRLPHSGIVFNLAFSTDISGGAENPYMDKVEIEITENSTDYFDKLYKYDSSDTEYLSQTDKCIQYIKEVGESR